LSDRGLSYAASASSYRCIAANERPLLAWSAGSFGLRAIALSKSVRARSYWSRSLSAVPRLFQGVGDGVVQAQRVGELLDGLFRLAEVLEDQPVIVERNVRALVALERPRDEPLGFGETLHAHQHDGQKDQGAGVAGVIFQESAELLFGARKTALVQRNQGLLISLLRSIHKGPVHSGPNRRTPGQVGGRPAIRRGDTGPRPISALRGQWRPACQPRSCHNAAHSAFASARRFATISFIRHDDAIIRTS